MPVPKKKTATAAAGANDTATLTAALGNALKPLMAEIKAQGTKLQKLEDELEETKGAYAIAAASDTEEEELEVDAASEEDDEDAAKEDDEDAAKEDDEDAAAKKDNDPSDQDQEDDQDDDDEEIDAELEDLEEESAEEEPGEVNKKRGDKNKGNKTSVTDPPRQGAKVPGNIAEGRLKSAGAFPKLKSGALQAAAVKIGSISAALQHERKARRLIEVKAAKQEARLRKQGRLIEKMEAQMERYADEVSRKSALPRDLTNLAAKANVDLYELRAAGEKLSVGAVDRIFSIAAEQGTILEPETRMAMKNRLLELGMMDQGEEQRYTN